MADKTFYNLEEAARELDVSVEELKSMISFGKLPEVSNGGERLIPAQAVDDFYKSGASSAKSTTHSADHYTDTEVARKLNKPVSQIWRMADWGQLPAKRDEDDRRIFPKQAIDQMIVGNPASNGTKQREEKSGEEYFTLEQISHALQRNSADVKREARTETINEQIWVSKKEAERVISRREPLRQKRIRKRLPKPHLIDKPNIAAHKTGEPPMKTVGKRKYYSLEEAAQFLGESVGDVWERIRKKQIPHENIKGEVCIPILPFRDFYYDHLVKRKKEDRKPPKAPAASTKAEEALIKQAMVSLIKNVKDLESELRESNEENKKLAVMLEKEKAQRRKDDNLETRLEALQRDNESTMAELKSESEKLRQEKQSIASDLEEEKKRREDAERRVEEEGHDLLSDFDKDVREFFGHSTDSERIKELEDEVDALKVTMRTNEAHTENELRSEQEKRDKDKLEFQYERDHFEAELENLRRDGQKLSSEVEQERERREEAERRARELYSELERDRTIRPETERWFNDLKAKLDHSEAERKRLDNALKQEIEKVRRLEDDASLLAAIRNLLGASFEQPKEAAEAVPSQVPPPSGEDTEKEPDDDKPEMLIIETRHGTWNFRPPFPIDLDEEELLMLVAGEDEITAEQIKARTGRKRAVDDLDDLLDRLLEKDLEPIIEDNDVYRFDPNFLQNES